MNAKKILGFLVCSSAFTKRNISSVGLVLIFFFVYILAGGRIDTKLPSARQVGAFGSAQIPLENANPNKASSKQVVGVVPTENRQQREAANLQQGRIFTDEDASDELEQPIDRSGLIVGHKNVYGSEREKRIAEEREKFLREEEDPLSALEERLKKSSR